MLTLKPMLSCLPDSPSLHQWYSVNSIIQNLATPIRTSLTRTNPLISLWSVEFSANFAFVCMLTDEYTDVQKLRKFSDRLTENNYQQRGKCAANYLTTTWIHQDRSCCNILCFHFLLENLTQFYTITYRPTLTEVTNNMIIPRLNTHTPRPEIRQERDPVRYNADPSNVALADPS
jgi:hypothetical protein